MVALLFPPGGPDLCALTGFCQTAQAGTEPNLLFMASALVIAGVVLQRRGGGRRKTSGGIPAVTRHPGAGLPAG